MRMIFEFAVHVGVRGIALALALAMCTVPAFATPNFIVIVADDMNAGDLPYMPNVNALIAANGASFSNGYVVTSLCCPSRATILRGQYVHNHGVVSNQANEGGGFDTFYASGGESSTVATWLQSAGYRTALFGKYLNGYPDADRGYVPPGWEEWYAFLQGGQYFNYQMNHNGTLKNYGSDSADYSTDVLNGLVLDFIDRSAVESRPFFAYVAPQAPHSPATPAPRHADAYPEMTAPRSPSYNESRIEDKPLWIRELNLITAPVAADIDDFYRRRLQSLLAVDEMVANIVARLASTHLLKDTYIVFLSDNGVMMGEHRLANFKGVAYQEAIKIPFLVRGPGIRAGVTITKNALNLDIAPTLARLAGVDVPDFVDGVALIAADGVAADAQQSGAFMVEQLITLTTADGITLPAYAALHTAKNLYIEHETGEKELYDLINDPYQLRSEHADPRKARLMETLSIQLGAHRTCQGSTCKDLR